ncbi:pilus assembly protein TadG-related protein [Naasia sp. SYSU D00948]|uniref:pilus assembly protein TadG-related protein n=1 Tax=Naasia sp. SYSU D00948 TaxID=2817379 RepID=UPI001B315572|nr:pilus assembly protein TadG-related protein [Naasia sp. SYSU D00948]
MTARPPRPLGPDEGSILPLLAGFVAIALALIVVVAGASSLYLERKRLYTLADAAALTAAQSFPLDSVAVGEDGEVRPVLTSTQVREAARSYLTSVPAPVEGLELEGAGSPDGTSAEVTLSAVWRPPLGSPLLPEGIRISVTSTARTALR